MPDAASIGILRRSPAPSPNFRRFFTAEIEKWRKVVKQANLKLE